MAYTNIQSLRKARAKNKGSNKRLAASCRTIADIMDKKGPEELSASEIKKLEALAKAVTLRLQTNAYTKMMADTVAEIEKLKRK